VQTIIAQRPATKPARPRRRALATTFASSVSAWLATPRLDARLAAGEDPLSDVAVACRSRRLVSGRSRRRLACGLERTCSMAPRHGVLSAAVAVDEHAVEIARPALRQLASALRSHEDVQPRGVAITRILLTDPSSALYRPAYREELYELAREALFALGSREGAGTGPVRR
jgi:hypothetical protein